MGLRRLTLKHALNHNEFTLHYQPIVDLVTGAVTEVEALIRWPNRDQKISPFALISRAEELNLISEIGEWVLDTGCAQLAAWRSLEPNLADLAMSINVSPLQFADWRFVDKIGDALSRYDLPGEALWLEITERTAIVDVNLASSVFAEIHQLGVRTAIDDFGTGLSALAYLEQFVVDRIKLDRLFVERLAPGVRREALVRGSLMIATDLGLSTVAEGVETMEQRDVLQRLGCELGQGYFFSKAVPAKELPGRLATLKNRSVAAGSDIA
ncbi:MAG: EAL domain-containing protein [Mycobacteriaceae bacterium]